jgi:hypothetical protein
MATHSISGNVGAGTVGEIVYICPVGDYSFPTPDMTVADASKNYSFTGLADGVYNLYTAAQPLAIQQVVLSGNNVSDANFAK